MARTSEPKGPDWAPERTLRVLRQQLGELRELRQHKKQEVSKEYDVWSQATWAVFIHGFGQQSHNLTDFNFAHYGEKKKNEEEEFQRVIGRQETAILSSIKELEMGLPEAELKGAYEAGDEFAFYKDLKGILSSASNNVFIVDNYLNTDFFELYVEPIGLPVSVRILTDEVRGNLMIVATKYARRGQFEMRSSKDVHDRHIFVDGRGWMVGQSIKDGAKKKPTYMVEIGAALVPTVRTIYEDLWTRSTVVVK
jgi:hypothetical protein